jgi:hypothetical protein
MKSPTYSMQILLLVVLLLMSTDVAQGIDDNDPVIPANTKMSLQLLSPISTATSQKGDKFSCKVLTPAEYAGVIVEGHVRSVKRSGRADKESKIDLAFDRITMADGSTATFSATVIEVFDVVNAGDQGRADNEGTVRSKSKTVKTSIKRAAAGALIGALVGGAIAGGQGAAVGGAIGASVGVTTTLASKGADLEFNTGTEFTVETNGPAKRISSGSPSTRTPPAAPSASFQVFSEALFRGEVPDNWRKSPGNPLSFAPEGAHILKNGRSALTHGAMMGTADVANGDLQVASDQFLAAIMTTNSYLHRQGSSSNTTISGSAAMVSVLSGIGSEGRNEIVTVYVALLSNSRLFYAILVVPEAESEIYRDTFKRVVESILFN